MIGWGGVLGQVCRRVLAAAEAPRRKIVVAAVGAGGTGLEGGGREQGSSQLLAAC